MTCQICDLVSGKKKAKKLYEDEEVLAVLNPTPAVFGHSLVMPKKHFTIMQQIPEEVVKKMFFIAQQISGIIFDAAGAEGTNVMINEGVVAGQKHAHMLIHVLPRKKDDGLNFDWAQKQVPEESMNKILELLKVPEGVPEEIEVKKEEPLKTEEKKEIRSEDYRIKQLRRIP